MILMPRSQSEVGLKSETRTLPNITVSDYGDMGVWRIAMPSKGLVVLINGNGKAEIRKEDEPREPVIQA